MKRLTTAFVLLATVVAVPAAQAQDDEKRIRIELRDGVVIVNGKEVDRSDANRLTIVTEDGEEVNVVIGDGGRRVWVGDSEDHTHGPGFFLNRFFPDDDSPFGGEGIARAYDRVFAMDGELMRGPREAAELAGRLRLEADPEFRSMERRIQELARRVRRADDDSRGELEAELDQLLEEAFTARLAREREHTERMSERLTEMRTRISERESARREIIERRKRQLLGERDVLDW